MIGNERSSRAFLSEGESIFDRIIGENHPSCSSLKTIRYCEWELPK